MIKKTDKKKKEKFIQNIMKTGHSRRYAEKQFIKFKNKKNLKYA